MIIELNGVPHDLGEPTVLASLVESIVGSGRGSAIVVDGAVVPRSQWASYPLRDGQAVELITAVQGG